MLIEIRMLDWIGDRRGGGVGRDWLQGHKGLPRIMEMFLFQMFSWAYTFVKIHHCLL